MKTYRITEKELNGAKPVAVGYKIFNNDWTAQNGYDYKDENGNVIGTIHKVDGDIAECKWGLHFSEKPQDCFNFYAPLQWNKFAKVEAYGNIIKDEQKSVAQIIKIVETYSFEEFIRLIQIKLQDLTARVVKKKRKDTKLLSKIYSKKRIFATKKRVQ